MVLTGQPIGVYEKLGLSPTEHIVMEFGKRVIGPKGLAKAPAMRGMSGGGVWIFPALEKSPLRKKLVGIFTGARKKNGVTIGTSISLHLSLILQYHSESADTIKNAQTSQDFEDWLAQQGDARKLPKEIVPAEFRSLIGGRLE